MNKTKIFIALICSIFSFSFAQKEYTKQKITDDIEITKLTEHSYIHTSYAEMPSWGRVASNGLIFINDSEAILFDSPINDSLTKILVRWITDSLKVKIVGFVPNHWHNDCMGGLSYLQSIGIDSYAYNLTIEIAKEKKLPVPAHGFSDSLILNLGDKIILCKYYGAAHSLDNIVVWIPSEKILFAGCMVKELASKGLGNTVDGDVSEWPKTINKVLDAYSDAKIVIPGHGTSGGTDLLKHTLKLLEKETNR